MSGPERLLLLALVLLCGPVPAPWAEERLPEEPAESGSLLLPGRLPWGASALPSGELLAPCEDQSLSVLDAKAQVVAQWRASARFSGPVTVAPRSSYQLLAAPLATGRFDILVWDPKTRVLASSFAADHGAEAVASAWGASGSVALAWKDGHVELWTAQGARLWAADRGSAVGRLLWDESLGIYAFGPGGAVLWDFLGNESSRWSLEGVPRGVLQTMAGDLYCWNETGLWRKAFSAQEFQLFAASKDLLGAVVDRQDRLLLTEPKRLRRFGADGAVLTDINLPRTVRTAAVLDDRGRIVVGTEGGLEVWLYDGRFLGTLDPAPPASPALLTDRGLGAWSGSDWKVHVWSGFQWPPYGWPQDGGGPGRPSTARRPASVAVRSVNWADDPEYSYFAQLVASGEEAKQREVLERFEAKAETGALLTTWPFANLILLKVGRSGLTDLTLVDRTRVTNTWPGLRLRAYTLLAQSAGPEDREELIGLLQKEYDANAAAQGARALAQSGWDGDGRLMRLLADLRDRMADQAVVADAVVDAARTLWLANGRSTDPVLIPLVSAVFQGPYPKSVKLKAQRFFQSLMAAP